MSAVREPPPPSTAALVASAAVYAPTPAVNVSTNALWNAAAWALRAWYSLPKVPNSSAIAVDTSSWAAGTNPVVGATIARVTSSSDDWMPARFCAAPPIASGTAKTKDMFISPRQMND